jgi:hypothetical protein
MSSKFMSAFAALASSAGLAHASPEQGRGRGIASLKLPDAAGAKP